MPPSHAALVPDGAPRKRYRLSPDAKLTRAPADEGKVSHGFYKDAKSGRLFRLGGEEFFLLTQLERGRDFTEASKAFRARFGTGVRETTIAGFAAQMVAAGVLVEASEPETRALSPTSNSAAPVQIDRAATDDDGPDAAEDPLAVEASFDGPDADDIDGLEDLIFSDPKPDPDAASGVDSENAPKPAAPSFRAAAASARAASPARQPPSGGEPPHGRDTTAKPDATAAAPDPGPAEDPAAKPDTQNAKPATSAAPSDAAAPRRRAVFRKTGLHDGVVRKASKPDTVSVPTGEPGDAGEGGDTGGTPPPRSFTPGATAGPGKPAAQTPPRAPQTDRAPRPDPKSDAPGTGILKLFAPNGLFAGLNALFGWMAWFKWLLWPLTLFAFMAVFTRLSEYGTSISNARGAIDILWRLVISTLTVNFCAAFFTGWAIHRQGGKVPAFGIRMLLYVIPRFAVDEQAIRKLPREGKLAVYATTMRTRLFLFAAGTVFWAFTRHSQTIIPDMTLLISQIALLTLVFTAFPLIASDGYKYLTTYFGQEMLKQRAHAWLFKNNQSKMGFAFPEPSAGEKRAFVLYTVGSLLFTGLVLTFLFVWISSALVGRYGGSGAAIFFALLVATGVWVLSMRSKRDKAMEHGVKTMMAEKMAERGPGGAGGAQGFAGAGSFAGAGGFGGAGKPGGQGSFAPGGGFGGPGGFAGAGAAGPAGPGGGFGRGAGGYGMAGQTSAPPGQGRAMVPVAQPGRALALSQSRDLAKLGSRPLPGLEAEAPKSRRSTWIARLVLLSAAGALIYAAFQPYAFDVGGDFTILPDTRMEVSARVAGELVEIYVDEGDVVQQGDLLARMSDWQPRLQVSVREAKLAQAEARLEDLLDGASAEEINIAQENVARAEATLPFLKSQVERAEELLARTAISQVEYERYNLDYERALIELRSAEAILADVTAPPSRTDVVVAEAEIERLNAELVFYRTLLDMVELRAPADGRIVTENVQLLRGKYLDVGEVFVEIEDHEVARAEVLVSETDIALVSLNDPVRLKAWAIPDEERMGTVVSIAPSAEVEEFGRVVRVKTQFPNEEGFFRPEMTGFAKIDGAEMKTWEAFSRLITRFFQIEVWGWIP